MMVIAIRRTQGRGEIELRDELLSSRKDGRNLEIGLPHPGLDFLASGSDQRRQLWEYDRLQAMQCQLPDDQLFSESRG